MLALAVLTLAIWVWLILAHGRFWQAGPVLRPISADRDAAPGGAWPAVSIVIPARDEAEQVAACVGSLLAQDYRGDFRIVLVDDRSSDGTGAIVRGLGAGSNRLTVLDGRTRAATCCCAMPTSSMTRVT
jgi:cellulose synthase/poly-beta-1,6-N-acetylglucosamine synthase-like glycosyltransferase